jgi:tetratricopeptide (TPR) repeat protein
MYTSPVKPIALALVSLLVVVALSRSSAAVEAGAATTPPAASAPAAAAPSAPPPAAPAATMSLPAQLARIDDLHRRRDDHVAWAEEQQLVQATLARAPNDYGTLWRAARLYFWLSDDPNVNNDQRSKWGQQGWDLAERAIAVNPNDVAGHYWAAVTMGNYALGLGLMKALAKGMEGKFKERLKRAGELGPQYEHGAIDLAWGRFYDKLPWPKRDRKKAQQYLRGALQAHPDNLRARVFLAQSLMEDDQAPEAKKLLDEVAAAQPGKYDAPEERRAKLLGQRTMPQLLAKLK